MGASLKLTAYEVDNSVNIQNNTSQLFVKLEIITNSGTYNHSGDTTGTITINGTEVSLNGKWVDYNTTTVLYSGTHTITHTTDGSRSVAVTAVFDPNTPGTSQMTQTRTVKLTDIPRAGTVGASDANIGAVATVSVVRKSTAYTHSVAYEFGQLKGYLNADGSVSETEIKLKATSIPFLLPEDFYGQIPGAKTGTCTLTCRTYSGSIQIGAAQTAQFTVTAREDTCAPAVSGTVADCSEATLALTGDSTKLVRYMSDALCTISASAKNSATLKNKSIDGVLVDGDTRTITGVENGSVVFSAEDSRGYKSTHTVQLALIPYVRLTAQISARRTDPTSGRVALSIAGNYYNGSFGIQENTLSVVCKVGNGETITLNAEFDGHTYVAQTELEGLDYQASHTITVIVMDKLDEVERNATVGKGIPVFDWGEKNFVFHVPVSIPDPIMDEDAVNKGYVEKVLSEHNPNAHKHSAADITSGTLSEDRIPTVSVAKGGTGAKTADEARTNLKISATALYTGTLQSGAASLSGSYKCYVIVGYTVSGNAQVSMVLPAALCDGATRYQLYADGAYINFTVSPSAITIGTASSGGAITAVYGVN